MMVDLPQQETTKVVVANDRFTAETCSGSGFVLAEILVPNGLGVHILGFPLMSALGTRFSAVMEPLPEHVSAVKVDRVQNKRATLVGFICIVATPQWVPRSLHLPRLAPPSQLQPHGPAASHADSGRRLPQLDNLAHRAGAGGSASACACRQGKAALKM